MIIKDFSTHSKLPKALVRMKKNWSKNHSVNDNNNITSSSKQALQEHKAPGLISLC